VSGVRFPPSPQQKQDPGNKTPGFVFICIGFIFYIVRSLDSTTREYRIILCAGWRNTITGRRRVPQGIGLGPWFGRQKRKALARPESWSES
jgi:hypothetical protein